MRYHTRNLLLAGASCLAFGGFAHAEDAETGTPAPMVMAQADNDAIAAAQQAVEAARAELEQAKAADKGVKKAEKALDKALTELETAEAVAMVPDADAVAEAAEPDEPDADVVEESPPEAAKTDMADDTEPQPEAVAEDAPVVAEEPAEPPAPDVAEKPALEVTAEPAPEPADADVAKERPPKPQPEAVTEEPAEDAPVVAEEPAKPPAPKVAKEPAQEPADADVAKQRPPKPPKTETAEDPASEKSVADDEAEKPRPKTVTKAKEPEGPRKGPAPQRAEKDAEKSEKPLPETAEAIKEGQKIEAAGGRTIEKKKGRVVIRHDDEDRFQSKDSKVERRKFSDGRTVITVERPNGETIVTVRDADGDIVKRTKQTRNGREIVLIDNERRGRRTEAPRFDLGTLLPPIILNISRETYIVESRRASPQMLFQTLAAPPVEVVERSYTLDEVLYNQRVRDKVRRIDVDTVTFEFGQAFVPENQIDELDDIARALQATINRDERELFLVEGHTDAVGSEIANLALSDRRAESVAEILTYYYDIPPENLITQGYGEGYLKVPTLQAERQNRRVTLRRITPLLDAEG